MKKVTAIIMAADVVFSLVTCGTHRKTQRVDVEPIKEVVSEQVSAYFEDVKETNEKVSKKISESFDSSTSKSSNTVSYNPYIGKKLGKFSLTFYVADAKWGYNTATGVRSQHLATCAVDPKVIPYGTVILIKGDNGKELILKAVDCGNGIIGNRIDVFWDKSISEGYTFFDDFGIYQEVYLLEE